jgi:hypothetical protein
MVRLIALAAFLALLGYAQTPASVIEQLTTPGPFDPFFSCSKSNAGYDNGRFLARRLVNLGGPAIPAIEAALDRYEGPEGMKNADGLVWLLFAYAKLEGPSAVTRLRRFSGIADPEFYATPIDSAVALARNLTSFVSGSRVTRFHKEYQCRSGNRSTLQTTPCDDPEQEMPMRTLRCDRGSEPRDALDELIVALYVGRESQVRVQLGPVEQASLSRSLPRTPPLATRWTSTAPGRSRTKLWKKEEGEAIAPNFRTASRFKPASQPATAPNAAGWQ